VAERRPHPSSPPRGLEGCCCGLAQAAGRPLRDAGEMAAASAPAGAAATGSELAPTLVISRWPGGAPYPCAAPLPRSPGGRAGMAGRDVESYRLGERLGTAHGRGLPREDLRLGRTVALKFLAPSSPATRRPNSVSCARRAPPRRWTTESLHHPRGGETGDGQIFIAMPCYEGRRCASASSAAPSRWTRRRRRVSSRQGSARRTRAASCTGTSSRRTS